MVSFNFLAGRGRNSKSGDCSDRDSEPTALSQAEMPRPSEKILALAPTYPWLLYSLAWSVLGSVPQLYALNWLCAWLKGNRKQPFKASGAALPLQGVDVCSAPKACLTWDLSGQPPFCLMQELTAELLQECGRFGEG